MNDIMMHLEQSKGSVVMICDRAVYRVVYAYFNGNSLEELPYIEVFPGVLEMRRSHAGFNVAHFAVEQGAGTRAAGPGTKSLQQMRNRLSSVTLQDLGDEEGDAQVDKDS